MASLRQIRRRIRSVENTKKITRAMEMVAAAKLKRFQMMAGQSGRYVTELNRILAVVVESGIQVEHPLLQRKPERENEALIFLITSDTGLCGSYNSNVVETAKRFESERRTHTKYIAIGKNGASHLRRRGKTLLKEFRVPRPNELHAFISEIAKIAINAFSDGIAGRVFFAYTYVQSLSLLQPRVEQFLPVSLECGLDAKKSGRTKKYIYEPSLPVILEELIPEFVESIIGQFFKHAMVAEQVSRMTAMRQATDNAKEMIENLTLERNKIRQASITKELIEVVSGSRALQS